MICSPIVVVKPPDILPSRPPGLFNHTARFSDRTLAKAVLLSACNIREGIVPASVSVLTTDNWLHNSHSLGL